MLKNTFEYCKWYALIIGLFYALVQPCYGQWGGKSKIEIKGTISIDSPDSLATLIRVMVDRKLVSLFYTGKIIPINTSVMELPVRLSILAAPSGSSSYTLANFWVVTTDSFAITGSYNNQDSILFFPKNELNDFEHELMKTFKYDDKLRLYAANSHNEAGLFHLWLHRFDYKLSELDYIIQRPTQSARAYSAYRLLRTFYEALNMPKQNTNETWKNYIGVGLNQQSYSIPSPNKDYTLVYLQAPGVIEQLDLYNEILRQISEMYRDRIQIYSIIYSTLHPAVVLPLRSTFNVQSDKPQPWPTLFDFTGESLLHFRVKLNIPLSNGFNYGLENKKANPSNSKSGRTVTDFQDNTSLLSLNFYDLQVTRQINITDYNQFSNPNQPEFLLFSHDGKLLSRWRGYQHKKILTDMKKLVGYKRKTHIYTQPE